MSQVTGVKEEMPGPVDSSDDAGRPEIEDEKPGKCAADVEMMQWALSTLQRTQYLSDSENEDEEKKGKPAVRVRSARKKSTSKNRVSWKSIGTVLPQLASPGTQESSPTRNPAACPVPVSALPPVDPLAVTIKEEPPLSPITAVQNSEDPVQESASACPLPVAASPPVSPSAVTIKEEPPPSPSAAAQNSQDPLGDSAFEPMDWYGGDIVVSKTECSTTPSPHADMGAVDELIEDPLEESVSACPMPISALPAVCPLAVTIKEEPVFFQSAASTTAEDPIESTAFEPKTACSPTSSPSADFDASSKSAFEEPTEDPLEGLAPSQTESLSLPTMAEYIISPDVKRRIQFTGSLPCDAITAKTGNDRSDCAVEQHSSVLSEVVTKIHSVGDIGAELRRKVEAFRMTVLPCSGDVSDDDWDKFVASVPPPRSPTMWTVRASTPEEKAVFHAQETARCKNNRHAFTYRLHGYESIVGPARRTDFATRVYDAVARLPNGVGSLADILQLLSDSQFVKISQPWSASVASKVAAELAMLSLEENPCLYYYAKIKMCVNLHRGMSEDEIEHLCSQMPSSSEASKSMASSSVKYIEELRRGQSLLKPAGPSASLPQDNTWHISISNIYPGKPMHPSNSGRRLVRVDLSDPELREIPEKFLVISKGATSALVAARTDCRKVPLATATGNGAVASVSSSSRTTVTNRVSPLPSSLSPSSVLDPVQSAGKPSNQELRKIVPDFITKLWNMVEDTGTDDMIKWSIDGFSFLIINERQFAEQLLLLYYKHQDMLKFLKELEKYGFYKKRNDLEFHRLYFVKSKPQLLYYIEKSTEIPSQLISIPSSEKLTKRVPVFLTRLWNMVDRTTDDFICWNLDGSSFTILDERRVCKEVLRQRSIFKFLEELTCYGFQKIEKDEDEAGCNKPEFIHKWFVKNHPHLLFYMKKNN